jgi:hypothetical protein
LDEPPGHSLARTQHFRGHHEPTDGDFTMDRNNPRVGAGGDQATALKIARWWHCHHDTASECTPFSRMFCGVSTKRTYEAATTRARSRLTDNHRSQ